MMMGIEAYMSIIKKIINIIQLRYSLILTMIGN